MEGRSFYSFSVVIAITILLMTFFSSLSWAQEFKKVPVMLSADQVLPKDLLKGPNFTVKDNVLSDGLVNIYHLETPYGQLQVESTALLNKRINELRAITKIEQLKGTDTYLDALKKTAVAPLNTAKGLITDPVGTVSGVVTGIGTFLKNVERSVKSSDPYDAKGAKALSGQDVYKRQFAYELGVNPYSSFEPLQKALDELAWTAAAGGLTVKVAMLAIPGAAGTVVGLGGTADSLRELVYKKTPGELEEINRAKLEKMGVTSAVAERFLKNMKVDPQEKTLLVGAISEIKGIKGQSIFIEKAAEAQVEPVVLFMRTRAQLMEIYAQKSGKVTSIIGAGGTPLLFTSDGKAVGIFPLDNVLWIPELENKESHISEALKRLPELKAKEFWITGSIDAGARKALEHRGWRVEEKVQARFSNTIYH